MERTDVQSTEQPGDLIAGLKYDASGLIPAIVQDHQSGEVLMMAWMNREALAKTFQTGRTHFFSRSRNELWLKGETSGHVQHVRTIATDCDQDVVLIKVEQVGAACHDGYYSCFYRETRPGGKGEWTVVGRKVFDPEKVYHK
jgi:phosphoribosyl-AMP cyclohydrolase